MRSQSPTPTCEPARIAVVIATLGRPEEVACLLRHLATQSRPPDRLVLSVTKTSDAPEDAQNTFGAEIIMGSKGLCAQRNRGLDAVRDDCDIVIFFDDDYVPARSAISGIANAFAAFPDVAGLTGLLLADGIRSKGISAPEAEALIKAHEDEEDATGRLRILAELNGLYGCNMAYRTAAIGDVRFDENLPLYGWQEDVDFASQLRPRGRLVRTDALVGVHKGVKGGRTTEARLGYSQIANPLYLQRKGTIEFAYAANLIMRNFLANHVKALAPEPWVDRRGRARGNWIAIKDLLLGRLFPLRALDV